MIDAFEAKRKTDANVTYLHSEKYVWDSLSKEIEKAIADGRYYCRFKETANCRFCESRKLIKDKMEAMGYEVNCHRYNTYDDYYDLNKYYNIYEISWRDC